MCTPDWLPEIIPMDHYGGNWEIYLEAIYAVFKNDFIDSRIFLCGNNVGIKKFPLVRGKERAFWHIIQEGRIEQSRLPNMRRCERIAWPRPIIEHHPNDAIRFWTNERHGKTRLLIWLWEKEYIVVLEDRDTYLLFQTAYPTDYDHTKRKIEKEFNKFQEAKNASAAQKDGTDTFSTRGR